VIAFGVLAGQGSPPVQFIGAGGTAFGTNWSGAVTVGDAQSGDLIIAMQVTNANDYSDPSSPGVTFTQLGTLYDAGKTMNAWSGVAPIGWLGAVTFWSGSFSVAGSVGVFRNATVGSISSITAAAATTTPTIPAATLTRDGGMAVAIAGYIGEYSYTSPSGWTTGANPTRGTGDLGWSYKALPTAGSSGDCVPTLAASLTTLVTMVILQPK
jgi:hypothetical protein